MWLTVITVQSLKSPHKPKPCAACLKPVSPEYLRSPQLFALTLLFLITCLHSLLPAVPGRSASSAGSRWLLPSRLPSVSGSASCRLFWARRLCRVIAAHPSHCEHLYWGHVKIIPNLFLKSHGLSLTERDFQSQVTFIILTSILTTSSQILAISPNDGFVY